MIPCGNSEDISWEIVTFDNSHGLTHFTHAVPNRTVVALRDLFGLECTLIYQPGLHH